ncbi:hypothetical protein T1E_5117 [Pseudomonas putida DOT-T1E]|uniref:Uncharacterized protein n=1 Tax=Pseudomonas putida (strain DOT-T1E) TaxID=1196325 RepID=I7CCI2_PSEPT|nr:hypothetical protein T1E_5117 [Pseudomonas putida DOT-T1E]
MKRHLLTLTLSLLAANAFALPASEQHLTSEARSSAAEIAQPLKTVAEGSYSRVNPLLQGGGYTSGVGHRPL